MKADGKQARAKAKVGVYSKSDALHRERAGRGAINTDKEIGTAIDLPEQVAAVEQGRDEKRMTKHRCFLPLTCKRCNLYRLKCRDVNLTGQYRYGRTADCKACGGGKDAIQHIQSD